MDTVTASALAAVAALVSVAVAASSAKPRCGGRWRDAQRMFTATQRQQASARAGGRCEQVGLFGRRCARPGEHADHIIPWSKSGPTSLGNCAWLCAHHNLSKGAKVPTLRKLRALENSRASYYPPHATTKVQWRRL